MKKDLLIMWLIGISVPLLSFPIGLQYWGEKIAFLLCGSAIILWTVLTVALDSQKEGYNDISIE